MDSFATQHDGPRWCYYVSTGVLEYVDAYDRLHIGTGYSGRGKSINRPRDEWIRGQGPIPIGTWEIKDPITHPKLGKVALRLAPATTATRAKLERLGRAGFLIHGDNALGNRTASSGCIVMDRSVRTGIADAIARHGIRILHVAE